MGLIAHPAIQRDLAKRMVGRPHHLLRALDTQSGDIGERSLAKCFFESPKEVSSTQSSERDEIRAPDRPFKVLPDESSQAFRLPTRESTAELALGLRCAASLQTGFQQCRRAGQACLCS